MDIVKRVVSNVLAGHHIEVVRKSDDVARRSAAIAAYLAEGKYQMAATEARYLVTSATQLHARLLARIAAEEIDALYSTLEEL